MITTRGDRDNLEAALDDILLLCSDQSRVKGMFQKRAIGPMEFSECELLVDFIDDISADGVNYFTEHDISVRDLPSEWSASMVQNDLGSRGNLNLIRYRRVGLESTRGMGRLLSPYVIEGNMCRVSLDSMTYSSFAKYWNLQNGKWIGFREQQDRSRYRRYGFNMRKQDRLQSEGEGDSLDGETSWTVKLQLGMSLAFCRDLHWYVLIKGVGGSFSVRIPTDPQGAAAAFKDRDASNSGRRSALKHWVQEHYRQKRVDGEVSGELIEVCRHMRGRIPFVWRGLECELIPAPFDVRRFEAEKSRRQRA